MQMNNQKKGFTLIEILVGLGVSAAVFVIATTLVVNIFTSSLKSRQVEVLAQVKNDLQAEFGNTVRWGDTISFNGGVLRVDSVSYSLSDGVIYKDGSPLTPVEVEVVGFDVVKYDPIGGSAASLSGSGLTVQYFDNSDFSGFVFTRVEPTVDFDWGVGSPDASLESNTFSVRASGVLETDISGEHTFYVASDDGARLWVDGKLVVDDWNIPGFNEASGRINLTSGIHDVRLDYYEDFGSAGVRLFWSYPGQAKEVVPESRLHPKSGPANLEILVELRVRGSETLDTLKLILSPRGGNTSIE